MRKVCGVETEYGIVLRGSGESNPIAASSVLINAYVSELQRRSATADRPVGWDFEDESPGRDARGFAREGSMPPEVETHLVNAVLTNGARYYVDHAHPEYSTPECADPLQAVLYDKAGERILVRSMEAAARMLPEGQGVVVYKNNSDRKGNSYGCHENYLMDRQAPFTRIVQHVMPHFVTRQIYTGAGKVGSEAPPSDRDVPFQLTQRADFFEEEVGLETTLKRPIVNTRDEPHADAQKYRRLHVIVGDANLSEVSTFLKVGVTALVLSMIEDDWFGDRDFTLATPVAAMRKVSYDLSLEEGLQLADGSTMTALQIQWEYFNLAQKYVDAHGFESVGETVGPMVLDRWERVLSGLETDPMSLADQLDWVAKYRLLDGYRARHGLSWSDHKLAAMDLQYHDLRPEKSLFARLGTERLVTESEVAEAVTEPPRDTRAYFRGKCLQRWASSIAAANWDSLVFDLGADPLRRVPMMEPLRGTAAMVDTLLEGCSSPSELLERLGS
ncbi:MAG: proteasome accessory factor PafA2 [Actinomycetota bacterium]|nr:proteasome accessory factor PafA2 [Actinomycetota bacterium]